MFVPPLSFSIGPVVNGASDQPVQTLAADGKTQITSLVSTPTRITVSVTDATAAAVATLIVEVPPKAPPALARHAVDSALRGLRFRLERAGEIQGVTPPADVDLSVLVGQNGLA